MRGSNNHPEASEPSAFRVAANVEKRGLDLGKIIVGLSIIFCIMISGGYLVRPIFLQLKGGLQGQPNVSSSVEPEQKPAASTEFEVGSEFPIEASIDDGLMLFTDLGALSEYLDAKKANDGEGIGQLINSMRLITMTDKVRVRILRPTDGLDPSLIRVRIIGYDAPFAVPRIRDPDGWVFTWQLKHFVKSSDRNSES